MGPIWGQQDPGGPHFGPMNFAIWVSEAMDSADRFVYLVRFPRNAAHKNYRERFVL